MSRSTIQLAAVMGAGLLLAACGGPDDATDEASTTSVSPDDGEVEGDDTIDPDDPAGDGTGADMDDGTGADTDADTGADMNDMDADTGADMDDMDADTGADMDDMDADMDMSGTYGEPADASEADRTIEVAVDNDLAFEPADYEVDAGQVVTFQITNTGDIEHEFVLGDQQAQQQMAEEMAGGDGHAHSGDMSNAVTIHAGEESELTWRFPEEATRVLIGCHVPGHWDGGMRGTVTVG